MPQNPKNLPTEEIAALSTRLTGPHRSDQEEAAQALLKRGDAGIEALIAALDRENRRCLRRFWSANAFVFLIFASLFEQHVGFLGWWQPIGWLFGLLIFAGSSGIGFLFAETARRRVILDALSECDDVRMIRPLVKAIDPSHYHHLKKADGSSVISIGIMGLGRNGKTQKAIRPILTHLFPRIRPDQAALLPRELRQSIFMNLPFWSDNDLTIAFLKALRQIGDSSDIPHVRLIAQGQGKGITNQAIREEAESCLLVLQQRAELEKQRKTLLRPATAPNDPAETLLRPAHGVSETDSALLLRPAPGDLEPTHQIVLNQNEANHEITQST